MSSYLTDAFEKLATWQALKVKSEVQPESKIVLPKMSELEQLPDWEKELLGIDKMVKEIEAEKNLPFAEGDWVRIKGKHGMMPTGTLGRIMHIKNEGSGAYPYVVMWNWRDKFGEQPVGWIHNEEELEKI
jgi:hypothetical protein